MVKEVSQVISLVSASRQGKTKERRHRLVEAVVELINEGGFDSLSPQLIAMRSGLSVTAVKNFGSNNELCEAVFSECQASFLALLNNEALLEGTIRERSQLFVSLSWYHYKSDIYSATIEMFLAKRRREDMYSSVRLSKCQVIGYLKIARKIFAECELDDREFLEALRAVHCFLTGLALENVVKPDLSNIGGYLRMCTRAMAAMLENN